MSNQDSNLKSLLSPSRSGTFFAPFRSRSANPDGFDSKMRLWINAIEEWVVMKKRLTLSLNDIHQSFVSDAKIRPDKECIRLVLSEMKRRSRIVPLETLKTSNFWSSSTSLPFLDKIVDPKGWVSWGVKNLVYNPASWAISALVSGHDQTYSDLTDMSITDTMRFVCHRSLNELSQNLLVELVSIGKAERQFCFEWQHLLELITPILNSIIDATDGKELLGMLDILIEYLAVNKRVSTKIDNGCKLVKISNPDDSREDDVTINQKDVAVARLLKAKELLTNDTDKFHNQAQRAKQNALECYKKKEMAKAKSLLRSHKRLSACANQKEAQLTNVEIILDQLENTDSHMMILQAYKDGAEALKIANTKLDTNATILDEVYDTTAEAHHLNEEMNQILRNISCASQTDYEVDLEAELNEYIAEDLTNAASTGDLTKPIKENNMLDDLEERLNNLLVCQDDPNERKEVENHMPEIKSSVPTAAT